MPKILVVSTSYPSAPGDAAGHFVETEARALARAGHRVTVLAPGRSHSHGLPVETEPRVHRIADGGAFGWPGAWPRLRQNPLRAVGAARFAWHAARAVETLGPFDRVVAHFLVPCAWPVALAGLRGRTETALEVVAHGSDARLFARLPAPLRRKVAAALARQRATLRCVSQSVKDELCTAGLGQLAERAEVGPCAVDVSTAPGRQRARQALALHDDDKLVVIVARLIADKRVDIALRALSLLPNLRVAVVGDGPERARLQDAFPTAEFTGNRPRSEALLYIAAADALVSASRHEGAPTVVREARALGVPVVAAPAGDLVEWARADAGIALI